MTSFVLIPGAGGSAWYWHRLVPELESRGHEVIAVELPADDNDAGLSEYAHVVLAAAGDRAAFVLVAQSMAGLTAPLVCNRADVGQLILVNAMIPAPGETGGEWWTNTDQQAAMRANAERIGLPELSMSDEIALFGHDVPREVFEEAGRRVRPQSGRPFADRWPLDSWPGVPTRVLVGRDDRLFPLEFQRRIARERLGVDADEIDGGHLVALSQPVGLAERLDRYARYPAAPVIGSI